MEAIFISGIFMSLFIIVLLLTKQQKAITDKILAVWVAVIGIHLLGYLLNQLGYWERYPHLIGLTAPVPLLHGPLLYLYCLYALRAENHFRRVDYLHFAPALAAYLYMSRFFFFYSAHDKLLVDSGELPDFKVFSLILLVAMLASGVIYPMLAYRLSLRHKHKLLSNYSYSEGISLQWIRNCIIATALVFVTAIGVLLLRDGLGIVFPFNVEYLFYAIMILFIFYIGYYGVKHEQLFINPTQNESLSETVQASSGKYRNSGMKEDDIAHTYSRLLSLMETEKPYLQPKLSLADLASSLGLSTNELSQVINQQASVNFYDFVNRYRVEEFLRLAQKKNHYNLLALAFEAGFNSKTAFNTVFKKQKGSTPSDYLRKIAV